MASLGRHIVEKAWGVVCGSVGGVCVRLGGLGHLLLTVVVISAWLPTGCRDSEREKKDVPSASLTRVDVMRGCLASDACGIFAYSYLQFCVASHYDAVLRAGQGPVWESIFDCVAQAGADCDQVLRCYGGGEPPASCSQITDGFCDGDVQVACDSIDGRLYRLDCSLASQHCSISVMPSGEHVPVCGDGPCNQDEYAAHCRGNLKLVCDSGYVSIRDCSQDGMICSAGDCIGGSSICPPRPLCRGQVLETCEDGVKMQTNCASLPGDMICDEQAGACVPAPHPCQDGQEDCSGTVARLCHDGIWMEVDCRDLGLARCTVRDGGVHCTG